MVLHQHKKLIKIRPKMSKHKPIEKKTFFYLLTLLTYSALRLAEICFFGPDLTSKVFLSKNFGSKKCKRKEVLLETIQGPINMNI